MVKFSRNIKLLKLLAGRAGLRTAWRTKTTEYIDPHVTDIDQKSIVTGQRVSPCVGKLLTV